MRSHMAASSITGRLSSVSTPPGSTLLQSPCGARRFATFFVYERMPPLLAAYSGNSEPVCPLAEPTLTTERIHGAGFDSLVNTKEELAAICQAIEAAGADALELRLGTFAFNEAQFINDVCFAGYGYDGTMSYGIAFDPKSNFQGILDSSHSGCGLIMDACRYVKQFVKIPVGGVVFMDPASAPDYFGQALNDDTLELIYVHRAVSNCDSEYANKLLENRIDGIRPCCRCLNCMGGPCRVNPTSAMGFIEAMPEGFEVPACDGSKKVMVIGGGPAGMEAARVCAECGYDVSLCEKSALGGLLDFAEMVKGKHESLSRLKNYLSHVLEVEGVNVVTGKEVDAAFAHEEKPDVVIVSTGSKRPGLAASGSSATPVIGVTDSLSAEIGNKVFFVDGDKLAACFDANVGSDTIEEMAKAKPWYAVIRDSSMADDATHANYEELFRTYSPDTVPQVI